MPHKSSAYNGPMAVWLLLLLHLAAAAAATSLNDNSTCHVDGVAHPADSSWLQQQRRRHNIEQQQQQQQAACMNCTCTQAIAVCTPVRCRYESCDSGSVLMLDADGCCPRCQQAKRACHYEGHLIEHNTDFAPQHCTSCKCKDGRIECLNTCHDDNNNDDNKASTNHLSPSDYRAVCNTPSGGVYELSQVWWPSACVACRCSPPNAVVECFTRDCPPLHCPHGYTTPSDSSNSCCPVCKPYPYANSTCLVSSSSSKGGDLLAYRDGEYWTSPSDPCMHCGCFNGTARCLRQNCSSASSCAGSSSLLLVAKSDRCCAECEVWSTSEDDASSSSTVCRVESNDEDDENATLLIRYHGEMWPSTERACEYCACQFGRVECMRVQCASAFCLSDEIEEESRGEDTATTSCCVSCRAPRHCESAAANGTLLVVRENESVWQSPCQLCRCVGGALVCFSNVCASTAAAKYPSHVHIRLTAAASDDSSSSSSSSNNSVELSARKLPFFATIVKAMPRRSLVLVLAAPQHATLTLSSPAADSQNKKTISRVDTFTVADLAASRLRLVRHYQQQQSPPSADHAILSFISAANGQVHNVLLTFDAAPPASFGTTPAARQRQRMVEQQRAKKELYVSSSSGAGATAGGKNAPRKTIHVRAGEAVKLTPGDLRPAQTATDNGNDNDNDNDDVHYVLVSEKPKYGKRPFHLFRRRSATSSL